MFITSDQVEVPETYLLYSAITSDQLVQVVSAVPVPVSETSLVGVSGSLDWIRRIALFAEAEAGEKVTWQVQVPD